VVDFFAVEDLAVVDFFAVVLFFAAVVFLAVVDFFAVEAFLALEIFFTVDLLAETLFFVVFFVGETASVTCLITSPNTDDKSNPLSSAILLSSVNVSKGSMRYMS